MTISTRRLLEVKRWGRVNPGRLESHPAFLKTLLHHARSTLQESRRKNKSRLSTQWGPRKNAGGFMHCVEEPSNPRRWPFTTCLNGTGLGMTLGKRLTHGPGKFHFPKDSFWDVIPSSHSSAQILPMAPYLLPVAYPTLCETWLHLFILFFIPSALPHLPTCCSSNSTETAPAAEPLNLLFP